MGKRPTPQQVEWQEAARERLVRVLDQLFGGNQSRLARALGVTPPLVNLVVRAVQPPTRDLVARMGAVERVNPHWAATGEGEPILPDTRGTLPVSDVLLTRPPADYPALLTGERYAVVPTCERPTCYYWRLPVAHPATAVESWRVLPGDLLLLETSRAAFEPPGGPRQRWYVLDGGPLGRTEPVYGCVVSDEKRRPVFSDDQVRLRFSDPSPRTPDDPNKPRARRRLRRLEDDERRAAEQRADAWFGLDAFEMSDVLAVRVLLIRP